MPIDLDPRQLAERLKGIRIYLFGIWGIPELSTQLGIPAETWCNYERGATIPGDILLKFIELTSVDSHCLATGNGSRFRQHFYPLAPHSASASQEIRRYAMDSSVN